MKFSDSLAFGGKASFQETQAKILPNAVFCKFGDKDPFTMINVKIHQQSQFGPKTCTISGLKCAPKPPSPLKTLRQVYGKVEIRRGQ